MQRWAWPTESAPARDPASRTQATVGTRALVAHDQDASQSIVKAPMVGADEGPTRDGPAVASGYHTGHEQGPVPSPRVDASGSIELHDGLIEALSVTPEPAPQLVDLRLHLAQLRSRVPQP